MSGTEITCEGLCENGGYMKWGRNEMSYTYSSKIGLLNGLNCVKGRVYEPISFLIILG